MKVSSLLLILLFTTFSFAQDLANSPKQEDTTRVELDSIKYKSSDINSIGVIKSLTARLTKDLERGKVLITKLSKGDTVFVNKYYPAFSVCFVTFKNQEGYIEEMKIESEGLKSYFAAMEIESELKRRNIAIEQKKQQENILQERKNTFVKKYGKKWGTIVAEKKIQIGMTKDMVLDSWGRPEDINRTVGEWGTHEQWVYGLGQYLYLENGKLTSWQD